MIPIKIKVGEFELIAELFDTSTTEQLSSCFPLAGEVSCWGEEIYFNIPFKIPLDYDARQQVEPGELAYWPNGPAFCIFFGPTPISIGSKPKAYSPVNVFGKIIGDYSCLKKVKAGDEITVSLA